MKKRGFEITSGQLTDTAKPTIPTRSTTHSAGYDFYVAEDIVIPSYWTQLLRGTITSIKNLIKKDKRQTDLTVPFTMVKPTLVPFYIKSYMQEEEYLALYLRSSSPKKYGLMLANSVGIIDKDYYNNEDNEGNIGAPVYNLFPFDITLKQGDRICQGIFHQFLAADEDASITLENTRTGGFGSTGDK